ncbi:MAG: hypothetical protein M0Q13_10975 [Methanothrix sp.]|jgi:hypothetical protein|nr:hypothetical protein [Methanothrix sp.]
MHRTAAGDRRQALQRTGHELARDSRTLQKPSPCTRGLPWGQGLQGEKALAEAEALKLSTCLEDLTVWQMKKVMRSRKGCKTYTYCLYWPDCGYSRDITDDFTHTGRRYAMDHP